MIEYHCLYCGTKAEDVKVSGFKCNNCGKSVYFNSKPATAIIPVFGDEMLITVRGRDPGKGKLDPVGGFLEFGEEALDGAIREFKEEANFDLSKQDLKFLDIVIGDYDFQGEIIKPLIITYYVYFNEKKELTPGDDAAELLWVPIDENQKFAFDCIKTIILDLKKALNK